MAELVDALDLGSSEITRGSSSLPVRTFSNLSRINTLEHKITEIDSSLKELKITIAKNEVQPTIDKKLREIQPQIELKGFRKGKVPLNMVKQLHGKQVEFEAIEEVSNKYMNEIIKKNEIRILGDPFLKNIEEVDNNWVITIEYETLPEIQLQDYRGLVIDEPVHRVTDEEIDKEITKICENNGTLEKSDIITDDLFIVDFKISELDESTGLPIIGGETKDSTVYLANNLVPKEFKELFMDKSVGDLFRYNPSQYDNTAPETLYSIEIKKILKLIPQEFNDDFVKTYTKEKFLNTEEFKEEIGFKLQEQWDERSRQKMEDNIIHKLMEMNPVEPPQLMIDMIGKGIFEDLKKRDAKRIDFNKINYDDIKHEIEPLAKHYASWEIIKNKIIELEDIKIEDYDIDNIVDAQAENQKIDKETIRKSLTKNIGFLDSILSKKLMDLLLDFAITNEVPFEEDHHDHDHDHHDHNHDHHDHDHDHDHHKH